MPNCSDLLVSNKPKDKQNVSPSEERRFIQWETLCLEIVLLGQVVLVMAWSCQVCKANKNGSNCLFKGYHLLNSQ